MGMNTHVLYNTAAFRGVAVESADGGSVCVVGDTKEVVCSSYHTIPHNTIPYDTIPYSMFVVYSRQFYDLATNLTFLHRHL